MAIPSSNPQPIQSAGSAGVQTDINIGSNVFGALNNLAAGFKRAEAEEAIMDEQRARQEAALAKAAQDSINKRAKHRTSLRNRQLDKEVDLAILESGEQDPTKWAEIASSTIQSNNELYFELLEGADEDTRDELLAEREFAVNNASIGLKAKIANQIQDNENEAATAEAISFAEAGDVEIANQIVSEMQIPDDEKIKVGQEVQSRASRNIRALATERISQIESTAELDELQNDVGNQKVLMPFDRSSLNNAIDSKRRKLQTEAIQDVRVMTLEAISGFLDVDRLEASNAPESTKEVLKEVYSGINGGLSESSNEYYNLSDEIAEFTAETAWYKPLTSAESISDKRSDIWGRINSGEFNWETRLRLAGEMLETEALDFSDGDLALSAGTRDLTASQQKALSLASNRISEMILGPDGRINVKDAMVDPLQLGRLWPNMRDSILSSFADVPETEFQSRWNDLIEPQMSNAIARSSLTAIKPILRGETTEVQ